MRIIKIILKKKRTKQVWFNNKRSKLLATEYEVPQAFVLRPLLYL